jgi:transcription initiation factor TFIID subunit 1
MGKLTDEDSALSAVLGGGVTGFDVGNLGDMHTEHAADAIDFEDEDELAEDELPEEEPSSRAGGNDFMNELEAETGTSNENDLQLDMLFQQKDDTLFSNNNDYEDLDIFDNENDKIEDKKLSEQEEREQRKFQDNLLKFYHPKFKKNAILKMNSVFAPTPQLYPYQQPQYLHPLFPSKITLEVETDQRRIFKSAFAFTQNNNGKRLVTVDDDTLDLRVSEKKSRLEVSDDLVLATVDWDYDLLVGGKPQPSMTEMHENDLPYDELFEEYEDDDILEGQLPTKLQLDLNDPNLLFIDQKFTKISKQNAPTLPTNEKLLISRFNFSNDKNYDLLKENYHSKVRSTLGNLNIEHSLPAIRLQSPFYKVKLTKDDLRNFHRQKFKVRPGQVMQFSKIKLRKKKRDRGKEIKESFAQTTDLTLADTAQTILMEHSEQVPLVIPNFGMGSKLINYYRKTNESDNSRPKLSIGETHVLGVQDKSPFWNFGFVEPGNIVPALYNKLVRAPVFKHEPQSTDFLLIKSVGGNASQKYFLKSINHLFVIGQLLPVVDIPGPHSRKVTTASKNRLKIIVFRVLKRSPEQRLLVKDISVHFPEQNDMQNRQRLKEFMEYQRSGDDHGFWKLKEELPNDRLISPEDLTLLESMQVSQQWLEDMEFYSNEEVSDELALWNLTKNFINATQGKAMLQLTGDRDGKSISFFKTSMKGGFKSFESNGHSYNVALQQKAYDEEISRAWYTQQKKYSESEPIINSEGPDEKRENTDSSSKYLKITRMVRDNNGILQRKYEIVKDPAVIKAYIKRREKLEEDIIPEDVKITNDEEKNLKTKKLLEEKLAKLEKNQERRNQRKAQKESLSGKGIGKGKSTTRRCATCGAIGHIRTNKACPMYKEANP